MERTIGTRPFHEHHRRPRRSVRAEDHTGPQAAAHCDAFDKGIGKDELIGLLVQETGETPELLRTMKPLGFTPSGVVYLGHQPFRNLQHRRDAGIAPGRS